MTPEQRLAFFTRDLAALMNAEEAFVIFNLAHDEDSYVQFSHAGAPDPLYCEVSNRGEGWNAHSLDAAQIAELRALGYEIPSPHHQANPHKEFSGDARDLAQEVERIFQKVFRAAEDCEVVSNGVES